MAVPTSAKQALEKLKAGPVQFRYDGEDFYVKGGIDVTFTRGQEDVGNDLVGMYDKVSSGDGLTFSVTLPESSMDALGVVMSDCLDGTTYRGFGQVAGASSRADAKAVRIRPWADRNAATTQIEIWLAAPEGDLSVAHPETGEHALTQGFAAFPDLTKANGELLCKITYPDRS